MTWLLLILGTGLLHAETPAEKAWNILTTGGQEKSHEKRMNSVRSLGLIHRDKRAEAMAVAALADSNELVRAAAADALGLIGSKSAVPGLKKAVKDEDAGVVFSAANALFLLGDPSAYQVYYAVLTGKTKAGDTLMESQMKMLKDPRAMTKLGLEAGIGFIPFGGIGYSLVKRATADNVSPVRAAAAVKLAADPDPKSAQALRETATDSKWLVRAAVVGAIAKRGDVALLPAVVPLMEDENDVVRFSAAATVIHLSKKRK